MNSFFIEPLEARIAPATVSMNHMSVFFEDVDGDNVTITASKAIFISPAVAATLVTFTGSNFGDTGPQKLAGIDFTSLDPAMDDGMNVSVTAKPSATNGGNGEISFGHLDASNVDKTNGTGAGIDLGTVIVQGDVSYIDAGDTNLATPALKSLTIRSIGAEDSGVESDLYGPVGSIKVRGSMLGKLTTHAAGNALVAGVGSIFIGGDVGSFVGGSGGIVNILGGVGTLTVKGNVIGGTVAGSGVLTVGGNVQALTISGSIVGGGVAGTGGIGVTGKIGTLSIGGSLEGSYFQNTGTIAAGSIGTAKIVGNLQGNAGDSGEFTTVGNIGSLTIGGSLVGGDSAFSGRVGVSGDVNQMTIGGSVVGGGGNHSGEIAVTNLKTLTLKGSLVGGTVGYTGYINTITLGTATIGGSIRGQENTNDEQAYVATIFATDQIGSLTINGDLIEGNVVAGINAFNDYKYGTPDDTDFPGGVTAKIGKIVVKGSVSGTSLPSTDAYGIEANQIGMISVGGITFHQGGKLGATTIDFATGFHLGPTNDFLVRTI